MEKNLNNTTEQASGKNIRKGMIITGLGTEITKWMFDDFEQVEQFYINNIDKWRLQNKVTKVIGTNILVYSKHNG
tara:strand:+ start:207 stop:431 length:225 start_codon:yes stop_codon:yes gene_type:complete